MRYLGKKFTVPLGGKAFADNWEQTFGETEDDGSVLKESVTEDGLGTKESGDGSAVSGSGELQPAVETSGGVEEGDREVSGSGGDSSAVGREPWPCSGCGAQDVHTKRNSEFPTVKTAPMQLHRWLKKKRAQSPKTLSPNARYVVGT